MVMPEKVAPVTRATVRTTGPAALGRVVKDVPEHEQLFVLLDANTRTGQRGGGGRGSEESKVLGAYAEIRSKTMVSDAFPFLPIMGLHC